MLNVIDLHVRYGSIRAVEGISFHVDAGECVALLGSNGAGKTSTVRAISGQAPTFSGRVEFDGVTLTGMKPYEITRRGIIQVPEGRHIFPDLTVAENLRIGGYQRKESIEEDLDKVLEFFPVLRQRLRQPGGTLSGGEQQMLAIGRALIAKPKGLMLDEPSLGLAPIVIEALFRQLQQIKQQVTVLIVEQNAQLGLELADRAYVFQLGQIVREGDGNQLLDSEWLKEAYLG